MSKSRPIRSTQHFLHKLRSIETLKLDVFKELFISYRDVLSSGLAYYRPKNPEQSKSDRIRNHSISLLIKEFEIDETLASFVMEISENLDLDRVQSYEMFCAFLLYDYAGSIRDVKKLTTEIVAKKSLISNLRDYYFREQTALLLSIVEILRLVQRPREQLPQAIILENFVSDKFATSNFVNSLLSSLKNIWTKRIEENTSVESRKDLVDLARQCFSLQEHLVRVLIWLFYVSDLPAECDASVLKLFTEQNFGQKQFYKKLLPTYEAEILIDRILNLEILFALKSFHLERLLMIYLDETREKDSYWFDKKSAKIVGTILDESIPSTLNDHSVLALAYALNIQLRQAIESRSTTNGNDEDSGIWQLQIQKYGAFAKRSDCLKFCKRFLDASAISEDEGTKSLARAVIYVALDGCLQFFEPDSLGSSEDLVALFYDVLRDENVADEFWSKKFASGASNYVLNEIVYYFYADFQRPLQVLRALAAASEDSAKKVMQLCQKLPVFCESIENIEPNDLALVDDTEEDLEQEEANGTRLVLMKPRQPLGDAGPIIPAGTRGRLIRKSFTEEFVQWEFSYNAWQLCLVEVSKDGAHPARIAVVLDLVAEIMKTDQSSITMFVHFLREAIAILKRSRYFETELLVSLLEPCFRCLASASRSFANEVLIQIAEDDIIPSSKPLAESEFRLSLISRILNDTERLSGHYGCTISFLKLMEYCCEDIACYSSPSFAGSIAYVCENIFSDCLSWPYEDGMCRDEIAASCLRICRKILDKWTSTGQEDRTQLNEVIGICRRALTHGEARRTLLRLACVGVDALKESSSVDEDGRDYDRLAETISLSLALLLELLIDFESTRTNGSSPQLFVDLFVSSVNVGIEPPLCSFARYLFLRTNDRIPKLALICMKRIAKLFPATILSTLGEWTASFYDALLTRLESPTEDVQVKVCCIEFLIAVVEYQPALAEQFLGVLSSTSDVDSTTDTNDKIATYDGGALDSVLAILKSDRLLPDLVIACVDLLAMIWRRNNTAAMDYLRTKRKEEFWPTLLAPLSAGEDSYYLTIVSPVIRILTREMFNDSTPDDASSKSKSRSNGASNGSGGGGGGDTTTISAVIEEIMEPDRLKLTFKKLREYFESRLAFADKIDVLGAWRDFFQVVFQDEQAANGKLSEETKKEILYGSLGILKIALSNFEHIGGIPIVKAASELCNLTMKYCLRLDGPSSGQRGIVREFESIFDRLNDNHLEEWSLQLSVILAPIYCGIFRLPTMSKEDADVLPVIFDNACSILVKNLIQTASLRSKNQLDSPTFPWLKALQSSLRCTTMIYSFVTPENEKPFLEILQKHSVLRNLRVLVAALLEAGHLELPLLASVFLLFESTAKTSKSVSIIGASGLLEWICVDLIRAPKAIVRDLDVLSALFALHVSILEIGAHNAMVVCSSFLASYSDITVQILLTFSINPNAKAAKTVARILQLAISMANYKDRWQYEAGRALNLMIASVCVLCYRLPIYLAKPTILAEILAKEHVAKSNTQQPLIETLFSCVQFLLRFTPDLFDACNNPAFDAESFRLLLALDLNTNLSLDASMESGGEGSPSPLTFGAMLLIVHLCVNSLRKAEAAKAASPSTRHSAPPLLASSASDRAAISALLESSLYLIISQAALNIKRVETGDSWQRTLMKRDLATELSQYLSRCGMRTSGGSAPTTPRKSPAQTPSTPLPSTSPGGGLRSIGGGFDYQYLKFVNDFVRDVLKNNND